MSFAPHTNTDVYDRLRAGLEPLPLLLGSFREAEHGNLFEYAERTDLPSNIYPEMPHLVYVGHGQVRFARVLSTVAYVVVDDDLGPERWAIRQHRRYPTGWVRGEEDDA